MSENMYYAGVGARDAPFKVCYAMTEFATRLSRKGYTLRSGNARGPDTAWETGAGNLKQIFKPLNKQRPGDFPTLPEAYEIAASHHSIWKHLPDWHKDLLARNVHIVLGPQLDDPVEFVICWTHDGIFRAEDRTRASGGTGHTIAIACANGVPVFNLNNKVHYEFVNTKLTM